MSLINNMLKDLQKREMQRSDEPYVTLLNIAQVSKWDSLWKTAIIITAALFIATLLSYLILGKKQIHHKNMLIFEQSNIVKTPEAVNENNLKWLKPNLITGISLQVKDNITEMSFFLQHASLYRVINNTDHHKLSIIFDHADLQSELPENDYLNTAIQNLTIQKVKSDTYFNLFLNPDSVIKSITLNDEDKNPVLIVAIASEPQTITTTDAKNTKLVKTPAIESLISQQYQMAISSAEKGFYQDAITRLSSVLKADPDFKDARTSLAALLIDQGKQLKAKEVIDEGLSANGDYVPFIELKARMLTNEGKLQHALALLLSTTPLLEDNPDYYAFIAALYERTNNDLLAVKLYKQLLSINADNSSWWMGLGISLEKLNQKQAASSAYSKALNNGHLNYESIAYLQKRLKALREVNHETQ